MATHPPTAPQPHNNCNINMAPKRARTVIDERQAPAIAAPAGGGAAVSNATAGRPSRAVSGVVSIDAVEAPATTTTRTTATATAAAAAQRRFAIPAVVLQRMATSASAVYQSAASDGPDPSHHSDDGDANSGHHHHDGEEEEEKKQLQQRRVTARAAAATAATASGVKRGRWERDTEAGDVSPPSLGSPTGSDLAADISRQISARTAASAGGSGSGSGSKPLILSSRWSRLRREAGAATAPHHEADNSGNEEDSKNDDDDDGDEEAPPAFANATDNVIRFGSSKNAAFLSDLVAFPSGGIGGGSSSSDADDASNSSPDDDDEEEGEGDYGIYNEDDVDVTGGDVPGAGKQVDDPSLAKSLRARRELHQRRERVREAKLKGQFSRHLSGYDDAFIEEQEARLLNSDGERDGNDSDDEDDDDDDDDLSLNEVLADGEDEEDVDEEDDEEEGTPAAVRVRNEPTATNSSSGGFGARDRYLREQQQQPQGNHTTTTTAPAAVDAGDFMFPESSPLAHRQRFGSIFFETHVSAKAKGTPSPSPSSSSPSYPCHHTLLCLRGPITIQGPCGLVGFGIGEASVGGFLLGKKQLVLWSKEERAVLMPVKKLKTKRSEVMGLPPTSAMRAAVMGRSLLPDLAPSRDAAGDSDAVASGSGGAAVVHGTGDDVDGGGGGDVVGVPVVDPIHAAQQTRELCAELNKRKKKKLASPNASNTKMAGNSAVEDDGDDDDDDVMAVMNDVEAVFGAIDWDWVQATINSWRQLFMDKLPTMLLVIQPFNTVSSRGSDGHSGAAGQQQQQPLRQFHNPMRKHYLRSARSQKKARLQQQQRENMSYSLSKPPKHRRKQHGHPSTAANSSSGGGVKSNGQGIGSNDANADDGDERHWLRRAAAEELALLESRGEPTTDDVDTSTAESDANSNNTKTTNKKTAHTNSNTPSGGAYVEVPAFISRRAEQNIDRALLHEIVPSLASQLGCSPTGGCVAVLGSQDIGKSTLCRFLANTLLSQHGLCYWLDLDLGQPEFGVPGQFSLHCVRRPLLRPHDDSSAELVKAFFIGSPTASSPQAVAAALAGVCAFVAAHVAPRHPVVVNTHGWVLHTGRRVTVEAVQRLLPRAVIHLVKEREEAWAADTAALMDPARGMNADVVGKRFLVRNFTSTVGINSNDDNSTSHGNGSKPQQRKKQQRVQSEGALLCHLPHSSLSRMATGNGASVDWRGAVHTVLVARDETHSLRSRAERRAGKGGAGRRAMWQRYLAPLLEFYESGGDTTASATSATTTLLTAPMSCLGGVVMADLDERSSSSSTNSGTAALTAGRLAATLEHRVVAVQFAYPINKPSSPSPSPLTSPSTAGVPPVMSLDGPHAAAGFQVTCYGYVESTERDMLLRPSSDDGGSGTIAIRLPLPSAVVQRLLSLPLCSGSGGEVSGCRPRILIAVAPSTMHDTHFMELYR